MKNFIIFFEEKEGTSPLVRLLDNFEEISVVHQVNGRGWEPFDKHNCGPMAMRDLEFCFRALLCNADVNFRTLNRVYTKTSTAAIEEFGSVGCVGFKMRHYSPQSRPHNESKFMSATRISRLVNLRIRSRFARLIVNVCRDTDTHIFFAVRKDVLRWAISKYRGDGSNRPGHLQFNRAAVESFKRERKRIEIDCDRLQQIIHQCQASINRKQKLMRFYGQRGISTSPIFYEDFLKDKRAYLRRFLGDLGGPVSDESIDAAISKGTTLSKVHSNDLAEFILNHEEVTSRFGP